MAYYDLILAVVSGVVQGVTEFLPISSSGHLVLLHYFYPMQSIDPLLFDVALHWGTLVAVVAFFGRDIMTYIVAWLRWLRDRGPLTSEARMAWLLIAGTIPVVIVGGLVPGDVIDSWRQPLVVATMLIVIAIAMMIADRLAPTVATKKEWGWLDAVIVGCAQAVALIPGTSRSGITMVAGLARRFSRVDAARFSFLLSIPAILAAGVLQMFSISDWGVVGQAAPVLGVGFIAAVISGYAAIGWLMRYLTSHRFTAFAWYRIILAIIIIGVMAL